MRGRQWCLLLVCLALLGCLADLRPRPAIPIPPNLTDTEAEAVLLLVLLAGLPTQGGQSSSIDWWGYILPGYAEGRQAGEQAAAMKSLVELQREVMMRQAGVSIALLQRVWFPEAVEPSLLTVGYQNGGYYLRVALRIVQRGIEMRLLHSRNLQQEGQKIHPAALIWMDELETTIRRALGQAAVARRLAPAP